MCEVSLFVCVMLCCMGGLVGLCVWLASLYVWYVWIDGLLMSLSLVDSQIVFVSLYNL